jgi:hypothetical protein
MHDMDDKQQPDSGKRTSERLSDSLTIRLPLALRVDLEELAMTQERSLGAIVRRALVRETGALHHRVTSDIGNETVAA